MVRSFCHLKAVKVITVYGVQSSQFTQPAGPTAASSAGRSQGTCAAWAAAAHWAGSWAKACRPSAAQCAAMLAAVPGAGIGGGESWRSCGDRGHVKGPQEASLSLLETRVDDRPSQQIHVRIPQHRSMPLRARTPMAQKGLLLHYQHSQACACTPPAPQGPG